MGPFMTGTRVYSNIEKGKSRIWVPYARVCINVHAHMKTLVWNVLCLRTCAPFRGQNTFFFKGPDSKYVRLCGAAGVCCNHSTAQKEP